MVSHHCSHSVHADTQDTYCNGGCIAAGCLCQHGGGSPLGKLLFQQLLAAPVCMLFPV